MSGLVIWILRDKIELTKSSTPRKKAARLAKMGFPVRFIADYNPDNVLHQMRRDKLIRELKDG